MSGGKLLVVPTPVGNLGDMTPRALEVLKEVSVVLAEDTRTTGKLLRHFGVVTPLKAFHQHNEHRALEGVVEQLRAGMAFALCSDAGTPGISDPGFLLVRACVDAGIDVECLPGATAFVPALVTSGLPCDRFYFEGFLPHKKGRQKRLTALLEMPCSVVLDEPPPWQTARSADDLGGPTDRALGRSSKLPRKHRGTVAS